MKSEKKKAAIRISKTDTSNFERETREKFNFGRKRNEVCDENMQI